MKKVLIIKPSGLGDIVHSLPVAIGLKKMFSGIEIHWLVFTKFAEIFKCVDYVDKLILWERTGGIKEYFRVIKSLRNENYDLCIDLQFLLRTAVLCYFSNARQKIGVSFYREFSNLFIKPVSKFNPELHAVERNYDVLIKFFNKTLPSPMEYLPWIKLYNEEKIENMLNNEEKFVLFSVTSRGEHKLWPLENFVELINRLNEEYKIVPVFVGLKSEKSRVEKVKSKLRCKFKDFTGEISLPEVCKVINSCRLVISNDNGIAHISAALDQPTFIIFGPTNPKWFYPYNKKSGYIYKSYKCSPCGVKPGCKDYKCMKNISVDEVFEYIKTKFNIYLK